MFHVKSICRWYALAEKVVACAKVMGEYSVRSFGTLAPLDLPCFRGPYANDPFRYALDSRLGVNGLGFQFESGR